jgi:hypothetical protein
MQTLTKEQFLKQYGTEGLNQVNAVSQPTTQQKPPSQGYLNRVGSTIKTNLNEALQSEKKSIAGTMNPFSAGLNIAKNVTGAIVSPVTELLRPVVEPILSPITEAIIKTPPMQKFINEASKYPELSGALADFIETGLNMAVIEGTKGGIVGGGSKFKQGVTSIVEKIPPPEGGLSLFKKPNLTETAIKDAVPNYEKLSASKKGAELSRVQEGGILEGRTLKPTPLEVEAGTELSRVPGYNPSSTKLQKYQVAKMEVIKRAKSLETSLENEKVIVPKKEILSVVQKAVNEVPKKSLLLQSSDPVMKNYLRVLKNTVNQEPGTLKGVLKIRKILDDAYENARGKQAFGSDKISALDDINKAARNSLTQYLIKNAKNTAVQDMLRSQWNLFRAIDVLKVAAESESGSILGRLIQQNPISAKIVKTGASALGVGGAVNILNP